MSIAIMTFEQFQATGRDVPDLATDEGTGYPAEDGPKPGRVYIDGLYIEKESDGRWFLILHNMDWIDASLEPLERHLYEYAMQTKAVVSPALAENAYELAESLRDLLNWAREHTSPTQENSPHSLLVGAAVTLQEAGFSL